MKPKKALLMANANSLSGGSGVDDAADYLQSAGVALVRAEPSSPEECCEIIRDHKDKVDAVILGGGDGTMHGAAPALIETGLTLGLLPMGTANDLARTLEVPDDLKGAAALIAGGQTTEICLGRVNGELFFNIANIGLGVRVNQALSSENKAAWGMLSYARTCFEVVRKVRAFNFSIKADDETIYGRSIQIAVGNGRYYGGGMTVHDSADLRKPRFNIYSVEPKSFWELLQLGPALRMGWLEDLDGVVSLTGKKVILKTGSKLPIFADGEEVAKTPAEFSIEPKKLRVFSPLDRLHPEYE